ncbi:MAG: hypothetical protein F4246_02855 [Rhodothermaceae bacterium]|nr:hypothetical protein [Rhodothermaceae bacterium]MXX59337.1 hypothetical protein [Rhodothermaceae bacterium]MYD19791.1 hypothetical protein [Rhodothermaceae bacterium]MYD55937.1 hypothetical protein [Rhodothermaceae bacterium]MYI43944.1 hypothetical protein [Rhodothermaceae bacterium]
MGTSDYTGEGLPENQVEACVWINLAVAQGDETVLDAANLLRQNLLPADLSKAETRAMELLSKD